MTNEEAIKILSPNSGSGLARTADGFLLTQKVLCALELAVSSLRAQQIPLDRSRWEGCEHCKADREGYATCFKGANGRSVRMYIPEGEAAIVIPGKYNHKLCIPIRYCPYCGRPLTEEA